MKTIYSGKNKNSFLKELPTWNTANIAFWKLSKLVLGGGLSFAMNLKKKMCIDQKQKKV